MITSKNAVFIIILIIKSCKSQMEPFVIDGIQTQISSFPHAVRLTAMCGSTNVWVCGSSILNQRLILTAAHCVYLCNNSRKKSTYQVKAYAGHETVDQIHMVRDVYKLMWHTRFDLSSLVNDIALLLLKKEFHLGTDTKRVMISPRFPDTPIGYIAGWGLIDLEKRMLAQDLQAVGQPIVPIKKCRSLGRLHKGMFCAGSHDSSFPHSTLGDSGSAFVITSKVYHQIGILSWTTQEYPALQAYTNVSYYYNWIRAKAWKLSCLANTANYTKI